MLVTERTPLERFMARMSSLAAQKPSGSSPRLYEQFKGEFLRACPDATPQQYTAAMQAAARAAGV